MKALIFGINGQDGIYLSALLKREGIEVIGISRSVGNNWVQGDVSQTALVENIIAGYLPNFVFHLAANSTTQHIALLENYNTITMGTINILESVYKYCPQCKVFISGSALQFENKGEPIDENTPFEARSAYSCARIQSVYAARYYKHLGLSVYVGYFFHHDSPYRKENHLSQRVIKAAQRIRYGSTEHLEIGNLDIIKEFNFAGDLINAVWTLVNQDNYFEAVIGSGVGYSIRAWVEYCFALNNLEWKKYVVIKDNYSPDFDVLVSNPHRLYSMGWKPKVSFFELANMMNTQNLN